MAQSSELYLKFLTANAESYLILKVNYVSFKCLAYEKLEDPQSYIKLLIDTFLILARVFWGKFTYILSIDPKRHWTSVHQLRTIDFHFLSPFMTPWIRKFRIYLNKNST